MERILADHARLTDEAIRVRQTLYQRPDLRAVQQRLIAEYQGGETIRRHVATDEMARCIAQPTLVYCGDRNRTPPSRGLRRSQQVHDGRLHCAVDTGHWAQFESADEHNRVVADFLRQD